MICKPIIEEQIKKISVGDVLNVTGKIYCGRDAVLPKVCELARKGKLAEYGIDLEGSIIFHTAVSVAGVGPTSSNKAEIEGSFEELSKAGVRMHIGKGAISKETIATLDKYNSLYAIVPPVTALLTDNIISKRLVAFQELGMEAFYELEIKNYKVIVAAVNNQSIC